MCEPNNTIGPPKETCPYSEIFFFFYFLLLLNIVKIYLYASKSWSVTFIIAILLLSHLIRHIIIFFLIYFLPLIF